MINRLFVALLFIMANVPFIKAQDVAFLEEPYVTYSIAMKLAHKGEHGAARDTLQGAINRYPKNTDLQSLMAKTYSWDGDYNEARRQLNRITSRERTHKDSWMAAIHNERFDNNLAIALGLSNKALQFLPGDADLLELRSGILVEIENAQREPGAKGEEKEIVEATTYHNQLGIINSFDIYDIVYDPMVNSAIEYIRETDAGRIIPRINYSNRFQIHGVQYELDLYPKFSRRIYGYLNYGYSQAVIFPNHRAGAELYSGLPGGFEASLGMRYLQFQTGDAALYTGSVGWYGGNYYISARPYINPGNNSTTAFSGSLQGRKYLRDKDNYLGIQFVYGFSPEIRQLLSDGSLLAETLLYVESQQLLLEYQFTPRQHPFIYKGLLGLTRQELISSPGNYFWALTAGLRYHVRF